MSDRNGLGPAGALPGPPSRVRMLSVLVEDHPGVLTRVGGMIMRRGFNIRGLSVGASGATGRSRMTLFVDAGYAEADQVAKQLDKLIEVIAIADLTDEPVAERELLLARLDVHVKGRDAALAAIDSVGGRVTEDGPDSVVVEVTGGSAAIDSAVDTLRRHGLRDLARSGPVAIRKNTVNEAEGVEPA